MGNLFKFFTWKQCLVASEEKKNEQQMIEMFWGQMRKKVY